MRLMQALLLILFAINTSPASAQPRIAVVPLNVLEGEPLHVRVTGLRPGQTVTLRTSFSWLAYPLGMEPFAGASTFIADAGGVVDLRTSSPLPGSSYDRADASGVFWSMTPLRAAGRAGQARPDLLPSNHGTSGQVVVVAESQGRVIASTVARIKPASDDIMVREVRDAGVTGIFARDSSTARQPAIIVLGGSEGGLFTARWAAPLLASHGYAVLGLGYFQGDEPGLASLPTNLELIPLETLVTARDWLARHPGVDASRIAVVGVSKGAEMALVAAAHFSWITAVAAFSPTHVIWEGIPPDNEPDRVAGSSWTYRGRPLPFVRWSRSAERRADLNRAATGSSRLTNPHLESLVEYATDVEPARIAVERSRAGMFFVAGTDDGIWPAAFSAEQLRLRLSVRDARLTSTFQIHPTGHSVMGSGWGPTTQFQRTTGRLQGGNARMDAEAQRVIWPAFLHFLQKELRPSSG